MESLEAVAAGRPGVGIPLGILIGVLSGFVLLVLMGTLTQKLDLGKLLQVTGEAVAIPAFWFGGSWITREMLSSVPTEEVLPSYIVALAGAFLLTVGWPLGRLVARVGKEVGKAGHGTEEPAPRAGKSGEQDD